MNTSTFKEIDPGSPGENNPKEGTMPRKKERPDDAPVPSSTEEQADVLEEEQPPAAPPPSHLKPRHHSRKPRLKSHRR
jgi:hypothetical protein